MSGATPKKHRSPKQKSADQARAPNGLLDRHLLLMAAARAKDLSRLQVAVLAEILAHLNERQGYARPSNARLAANLGATVRGVILAVKGLVEGGWLKVQRGGGSGVANHYWPVWEAAERVNANSLNLNSVNSHDQKGEERPQKTLNGRSPQLSEELSDELRASAGARDPGAAPAGAEGARKSRKKAASPDRRQLHLTHSIQGGRPSATVEQAKKVQSIDAYLHEVLQLPIDCAGVDLAGDGNVIAMRFNGSTIIQKLACASAKAEALVVATGCGRLIVDCNGAGGTPVRKTLDWSKNNMRFDLVAVAHLDRSEAA